jgi:hypothetical protein
MTSFAITSSTQTDCELDFFQCIFEEEHERPDEQKQKLAEYRKNQHRITRNQYPFATIINSRGFSVNVYYQDLLPPPVKVHPFDIRTRTHHLFYKDTGPKALLQYLKDIDGKFRLVKDHRNIDRIWLEDPSYWRKNKHNHRIPYMSDKPTQTEKNE